MNALASPVSVTQLNRGLPLRIGRSVGRRALQAHEKEPDQAQNRRTFDRTEDASVTAAVAISPPEFVARRRISWRGMAAETIEIKRHGRLEFRFRAPVHLLVLLESGVSSERDRAGLPGAPSDQQRKLMLVPAGQEYLESQDTRSLLRLAWFYFDPAALRLDTEALLSPRLFFEDTELLKTALKLKATLETLQADDRDYGEALAIVLAYDLARLAPSARRSARKFRGGLAGWQQQAVARYIEKQLAEHVSLASLAALVRLSPYHFSRAFKQSFGMPPHRFHTHRRIEQAKALLANPQISASEVGMTVGFSSASAFTMSFRKVTGVTPTDYRRALI